MKRLIFLLLPLSFWACNEEPEFINTLFVDAIHNHSADVWGIHFLNESTGFVWDRNGTLLKTINGGSTWEQNGSFGVTSLSESPDGTLYASGGSGLFKSTDVGESWEIIARQAGGGDVIASQFFPNGTGYIINRRELFKTTDGGNRFSQVTFPRFNIPATITWIYFVSPDTGYMDGNGVRELRTTDGGNTWEPIEANISETVTTPHFFNNNIGFIATIDGSIHRTLDGGNTWEEYAALTDGLGNKPAISISSIQAISPQVIIAGGLSSLAISEDGGQSYELFYDQQGRSFQIDKASFVNEKLGFGIHENTIYTFTRP